MGTFDLQSKYSPSIDQQKAIDRICEYLQQSKQHQTLVGVTGSGKTFTMANIINNIARPSLIMTHNKTLAAQLYNEFKEFFPNNAVEYFVSYYDYFQPEAYVPKNDLYIEKDSSIDDNLDKLRLSATRSLFDREDVIIVSSVSCIYGLGSPEAYSGMILYLGIGSLIARTAIIAKLVEIRYERNNIEFKPGVFRIRGEILDIFPAYQDTAIRVLMYGDQVEEIMEINALTGKKIQNLNKVVIYPASHYVQPKDQMPKTLEMIKEELVEQLQVFKSQGKLLEAQRLEERTNYDLEMLEETGTCNGVENYSRIMTRRNAGEPPPTLIDYFPLNSLLFIDESHVTIPQINGMYKGDYARKKNLVDYGFRLPSAIDNRPLKFAEFEKSIMQKIYISATPADYEIENSAECIVEQIIRPTGLLDPAIEVRSANNQIDDLFDEIQKKVARKQRVLVTTLTKKMAEDLTDYLQDLQVKVRYLHSEIDALERTEILRNLRLGVFDVLVGINLLREGLDLPEVGLVAILDADKEGFLRSARSLMQTCGRAARNAEGIVIMYADKITKSMQLTIDETNRRRQIQIEYNLKHNITPKTIIKDIPLSLVPQETAHKAKDDNIITVHDPRKINKQITAKKKAMFAAAKALKFEQAATIRDQIKKLENRLLGID